MRNLAIGNNQLWDVQYVDPLVEEEVATKGRNSKIPHKVLFIIYICRQIMEQDHALRSWENWKERDLWKDQIQENNIKVQ